jgi:serine/threonine protein phosphatase PrpC
MDRLSLLSELCFENDSKILFWVFDGIGGVPHPETGKTYTDLESAMHTIEIIEMLEEKTEGNLDTEEQKLIESLLYDLRTAYVQEKKKAQGPTVKN